MDSLEIGAKTVEEAVALALERLGVERDQVDVEVLAKGSKGLLGLGAGEARVRVSLRGRPEAVQPPADLLLRAKEVLEGILERMDVDAHVEPEQVPASDIEESKTVLDVRGDDLGILIGRRGQTLASLQYIVNLILSRRYKSRVTVSVDVEGYRRRRTEALRNLALRLAERVRESGQVMTMEPMPPAERRVVHLTLAKDPDVVTHSAGEGEARKVVLTPRK